MDMIEIFLRLGTASVVGLLLGLDRELRGVAAGLRTHGLAALSSALLTVSALMLAMDFHEAGLGDIDPLRVVQGLAQAVGFVAAGAIFFDRGMVHNLTTAANIWLAASIGIACGMGQYTLVLVGALLGAFIITVVRVAAAALPGNTKGDQQPASQPEDRPSSGQGPEGQSLGPLSNPRD